MVAISNKPRRFNFAQALGSAIAFYAQFNPTKICWFDDATKDSSAIPHAYTTVAIQNRKQLTALLT